MLKQIFVVASLVVPAQAFSAEPISGVYTNLAFNTEAGDLLGTELFIFPSHGSGLETHYSVLVQFAEGDAPQATLVPAIVTSGGFEFTMPSTGTYANAHFVAS